MDAIIEKIKKSLDEVRPFLVADGGDLELVEVTEDMVVKVKLLGACGSCPFSVQTLKLGVEEKLKRDVPEVKEVVSV
jgi:Fe-S cluster biogenesis protein NfuA